jgi:hypothetical protein
MQRNRKLSFFASILLLLAGTASAEQRYFELTGTVTHSEDPSIAAVGSKIRLNFNYDDAAVGDYWQGFIGFYDVDTELAGEVDGRTLVSDSTTIMMYDYADSAGDLFDFYSRPGIMIDDEFLPEAFFGFRLMGSGLQGLNLPASFDLTQFNYAAGEVMFDGYGTLLLEFSVDAIASCVKQNGKPDKHCKGKRP